MKVRVTSLPAHELLFLDPGAPLAMKEPNNGAPENKTVARDTLLAEGKKILIRWSGHSW